MSYGRAPETGESTASIKRRADDMAWPDIESGLVAGGQLYRPYRLRDYAVRGLPDKDRRNGRMLSATAVKRLEREGKLRQIGVDTYGLANG